MLMILEKLLKKNVLKQPMLESIVMYIYKHSLISVFERQLVVRLFIFSLISSLCPEDQTPARYGHYEDNMKKKQNLRIIRIEKA